MKNRTKFAWLLIFLALCFVVAFLGSFASQESLTPWYSHLIKPRWNPPSWVFGPVWTILYIMIAFSGWSIFLSSRSVNRSWALFFYFIQLVLNGLWSFFFFYFQNPLLSLIDIILLNIFILATIVSAFRCSKTGAFLLIPYFLWTLFAFTLNAAIVYLN